MKILFILLAPFLIPVMAFSSTHRPTVAVVLSGGVALGYAHIGVLKKIEEYGIPVDVVVGTSMGAVVGGLYCAGKSPDEIAALMKSVNWKKTFRDYTTYVPRRIEERKRDRFQMLYPVFEWHGYGEGLLEGQNILTLFEQETVRILPVEDFDRLPVRFRAVATELTNRDKGNRIILSNGSIAEAMRASMSFPGLFVPYDLNGQHCGDGGLVANLPVDVAAALDPVPDIIIAVQCDGPMLNHLQSPMDAMGQALNILVSVNVRNVPALSNLYILKPAFSESNSIFDFNQVDELRACGEKSAGLDRILSEISNRIGADALVKPRQQKNRAAAAYLLPFIGNIRVENGGPDDEKLVQASLRNLSLKNFSYTNNLAEVFDPIQQSGRFKIFSFRLEPSGEGTNTAVIRLQPRLNSDGRIIFNILAEVHYNANFNPFYYYQGFSGMLGGLLGNFPYRDASLFGDVMVLSGVRGYIEWYLPVPLTPLFLLPYWRWKTDYNLISVRQSLLTNFQHRSYGVGCWFGAEPVRQLSLKAGYFLEFVEPVNLFSDMNTNEKAGMVRGMITWDSRDSVIPEHGEYLLLDGQWADPSLGGNTGFAKAGLEFQYVFGLPALNSSLALSASLGGAAPLSGASSLSPYRYLSLYSPLLFSGYEYSDLYGAFKDAFGADVFVHLFPFFENLANLFGFEFELHAMGGICVGNVFPALPESRLGWSQFFCRWNVNLGLGVTFTRNFGLAVRGFLDDRLNAGVTIDFGQIFYQPLEERY